MARCQQTLHLFFFSFSAYYQLCQILSRLITTSPRNFETGKWNNFFSTWQFFNKIQNIRLFNHSGWNFNFNLVLKILQSHPSIHFDRSILRRILFQLYLSLLCFVRTIVQKLKFVGRTGSLFSFPSFFFKLLRSRFVTG